LANEAVLLSHKIITNKTHILDNKICWIKNGELKKAYLKQGKSADKPGSVVDNHFSGP